MNKKCVKCGYRYPEHNTMCPKCGSSKFILNGKKREIKEV